MIRICYIEIICLQDLRNSDEPSQPTDETAQESNAAETYLATRAVRASREPRKRRFTPDPFEREIINAMKANVPQPQRTPDPDEMFFLSQVPVLKRMSLSDKLDFQVKFIQLLQSYSVSSKSSVSENVRGSFCQSTPLYTSSDCSPRATVNSHPSCPSQPPSEPSPAGSNIGSELDTDDSMLSFFQL